MHVECGQGIKPNQMWRKMNSNIRIPQVYVPAIVVTVIILINIIIIITIDTSLERQNSGVSEHVHC
jgi:uncharacterized membrane protein